MTMDNLSSPPGYGRRYDRNPPGSGKNGTLVDVAESEGRLAGQAVGGMVVGWAVREANVNPDGSEQPERPFTASAVARMDREDRSGRRAE